jgi:hypothetical protein
LLAAEEVFMNAKAREFDQQGKTQDLSWSDTESNLHSVLHSSSALLPWNLHRNITRGADLAPYCLAGMGTVYKSKN